MSEEAKIKVFYNSACPVCDAGISMQKKRSSQCGVEWKDVHIDNDSVKGMGADLEFVRERLHVVDMDGKLHIGYEAFIAIWMHSPSEQWKARISMIPIIRQFLNFFYNGFAKLLYKWNRILKHW